MTAAALYDAVVTHTRRHPVRRTFRHRTYLWLVDLDRLPTVPRWLRPVAQFRAVDHLGSSDRGIRENLDTWLAGQGVDLRGGRVLMLTNARVLGHVFNPITVYWCHDPDDEPVCVVAEVHNTYGERHCYLLRPDPGGRVETDKAFYVSPFLTVEGRYVMRLARPAERLSVAISLRQGSRTPFSASLTGVRRPATPWTLLRLLWRHPLPTHRVSALIRCHGIALWLRRLPVVPRTPHNAQEGVR
ncbi:DUF1365 family protein [Saccharothrix ecbatanensis]|uniref:DUF1365 family protein n=1 Tax=Saccharothrix ecbatanensis TaxID=1105145 RepID=A0A7W9HFM7_9PSEU|nr:DUF1365 domain-containing protein [Saccharothrix ecbatanensis]MBB5801106.1 DUF1365 family protein [Saccharothrix ecbatanensis]